MNKNKLFASAIMSATAFFVYLMVLPFWVLMGIALLSEGVNLFYGMCCILALILGIVVFILELVLAVKTRIPSDKKRKGLVITTMIFELLLLFVTLMVSIFGINLLIVPIGAEGLLSYGSFALPLLFACLIYFVSIILKIVSLCQKNKAQTTPFIEQTNN